MTTALDLSPLATRSSDVRQIGQCVGLWFLSRVAEAPQAPASFFHLGDQLHQIIAATAEEDLSLTQALERLNAQVESCTKQLAQAERVLEGKTRTVATMQEDAEKLLRQWWRFVHPSSRDQLPEYAEMEWPPRVEVPFYLPPHESGTRYPVWGTADAVYRRKDHTGYVVVDWKSGQKKIGDTYQLNHYRYGLGLQDAAAWFHHLSKVRTGSMIQPVEYPGDEYVRTRIRATEAIKQAIVEDGSYPRFQRGPLCNYCAVKDECPAIAKGNARDEKAAAVRRLIRAKHTRDSLA